MPTSARNRALARAALLLLAATPALSGCTRPEALEPGIDEQAAPALKDVFADDFRVGAALNPDQFFERDTAGAALIERQFNTITPENVMKWENIHPQPGTYAFEAPDRYVDFGEANGMFIIGHTLIWHNQTPRWVYEDAAGNPVGRDTLLARMRDHIHTVVGRYKGRVDGWDVVNEALNNDGTLRQTPWLEIIGEDYIARAFQFAHEADPDAELYYNDYSLENPAKREGAVRLVRSLLDQGVPVTSVGTQGHFLLDSESPSTDALSATIEAFAGLGVDVMITELDVAVLPRPQQFWGADITKRAELSTELNPYPDAFPDSLQQKLARRYAAIFDVLENHADDVTRVTFWGVTDKDSWLNNWPIRGRTSYPLLFDRNYQPKLAFQAVVDTADR